MKGDIQCVKAVNGLINNLYNPDIGKSIKGTVKEKTNSIPCRVRLFEKSTGILVFETVTDENGNYSFTNLNNSKFFVVVHHPLNKFNAVIQDSITPT